MNELYRYGLHYSLLFCLLDQHYSYLLAQRNVILTNEKMKLKFLVTAFGSRVRYSFNKVRWKVELFKFYYKIIFLVGLIHSEDSAHSSHIHISNVSIGRLSSFSKIHVFAAHKNTGNTSDDQSLLRVYENFLVTCDNV